MEYYPDEYNEKEESKDNHFLKKKTKRGRKPKDQTIITDKYKEKDDSFCKNEIRSKNSNEKLELPEIKENLKIIKDIFSKEKPENVPSELANLKNIEEDKYFVIKYWDDKEDEKEKKENLDRILVQYLKEYSQKVNKNYFFLMLKLIVFLKEYINSKTNEKASDEKYAANIVKNLGNDFVILFLKKERGEEKQTLLRYFKMESIKDINNEIKELYIHLCFWLYEYKYAESFLIEYESDEENSEGDEKQKKNKKTKKDKKKSFNVKKIK
jgi:hypothetical protein